MGEPVAERTPAGDRRVVRIPVTWEAANRKKDRSVSLRFVTAFEVPNDEFAIMDTYAGKSNGWLLYAENELTEADVPKEIAPVDAGQKKPSVRLRAVLYRVWEQKTDMAEPFDASYYPRQMEKIINRFKQELEP